MPDRQLRVGVSQESDHDQGTNVKAPALGQWHKLRITADQNRIQGWLNDQPLIDQRHARFASGRVGLWTKADSITAFDDLTVLAVDGG
jgi:hypothetical protein